MPTVMHLVIFLFMWLREFSRLEVAPHFGFESRLRDPLHRRRVTLELGVDRCAFIKTQVGVSSRRSDFEINRAVARIREPLDAIVGGE